MLVNYTVLVRTIQMHGCRLNTWAKKRSTTNPKYCARLETMMFTLQLRFSVCFPQLVKHTMSSVAFEQNRSKRQATDRTGAC